MEQDSKRGRNMKVCLVGSSGGHLTHLYMLKPFWENKNDSGLHSIKKMRRVC